LQISAELYIDIVVIMRMPKDYRSNQHDSRKATQSFSGWRDGWHYDIPSHRAGLGGNEGAALSSRAFRRVRLLRPEIEKPHQVSSRAESVELRNACR
jgi:hypothetical protein